MPDDTILNGFWSGRGLSIIDGTLFVILQTLATRFAPKLIEASGRFSLRTRISAGILAAALVSSLAIYWGIPPYFAMLVFGLSILGSIHFILANLSSLGVVNAFSSTKKGISPEESLKMVRAQFDFLGVGAKKLSDLAEFKNAMKKAKAANKKIRLLLSSPDNPALHDLAVRNGKDTHAYTTRVRDSIRHLLHLNASSDGGMLEIKLYNLTSDFAMPHFRLMFIDSRLCIFSHVVWNDTEGDDNPQLLIRNKAIKQMPEASMYNAYFKYFQDLWNSADATTITDLNDARVQI
jgi:hypothetical protein